MRKKVKKESQALPLIVGLIFAIVGFGLAGLFTYNIIKTSVNMVKIEAVVIDVEIGKDSDGDIMGRPILQYEYNGVTYVKKHSSRFSTNICPMVGEVLSIYINPTNPEKFDFINWTSFMPIGMGVIFAGMGSFVFIVACKGGWHSVGGGSYTKVNRKNKKALSEEDEYESEEFSEDSINNKSEETKSDSSSKKDSTFGSEFDKMFDGEYVNTNDNDSYTNTSDVNSNEDYF